MAVACAQSVLIMNKFGQVPAAPRTF